ncbi:uncharacterized protein Tco025E_01612 [Trypanosoma conorhini]|uniref:START domain-containing protein n=1 Tax=Trypanosoma conorhini TaxID=83891 RepID=A0A3S5IUI9_9TRYP|nr:uncharacterized protein Tco025E_01612 [Trypanosoma conorhini]RNF26129.1 hypothetical protein Tco025E_01612 [Trypanosoma conorhini]
MAYLVRPPLVPEPPSGSAPHKRRVPDNDDDLYREAVNFADVERLLLAGAGETGFKLIAQDAACGISLHSRPVEECPMHLMRAEVGLPCRPAEVLAYLNVSTRRRWDRHIAELSAVRTLPRPGRDAVDAAVVDVDSVTELQLLPGQRRVALYYMAVRTPIPLVQNRDFELVVAEEVRRDGTVWVKAFSTPLGYVEPLDPRQSVYVRALMLFSGILARPVPNSKGNTECHVSYVALVHPMGLIPSVVVNLVLGAQLSALRRLQRFIRRHPLSTLAAEITASEARRGNAAARPEATEQPAGQSAGVVGRAGEAGSAGGSGSEAEAARGQTTSEVRRRLAALRARVRRKLPSML